jgi:hypothetical protein
MPNPHPRGGPAGERLARLDALAAELTARGWTAYVTTPRGRPARLFVQSPHDQGMCADVLAAADSGTGDWWFWFGWAERIAPAGAPDTAAAVIVTELRRPADDRWERAPGSGRRRRAGRMSLSATSGRDQTSRRAAVGSAWPHRPGERRGMDAGTDRVAPWIGEADPGDQSVPGPHGLLDQRGIHVHQP